VDSTATIGVLTALVTVATVIGAVAFMNLVETSPYARIGVAMALAAVGFAVIAIIDRVPQLAATLLEVGLVVSCIGCGFLLPTLLTWSVSILRISERGRGTGVWTSCYFLGQFLAPLILVTLADRIGVLATFGWLAALCGVVGGLVSVRGRVRAGARRSP
jgi:MFS family permease